MMFLDQKPIDKIYIHTLTYTGSLHRVQYCIN